MIHPVRTMALAATVAALTATQAMAQRGRAGGTLPRMTTTQPVAPAAAQPMGQPMATRRGTMAVPRHPPGGRARAGDLPRIVTEDPRRPGYRRGSGVATTTFGNRGPRYGRAPYTRWGVGAGCGYGCYRSGASIGVRSGRFSGSFFIGYPFGGYPFAVPVFVPYGYVAAYDNYVEPVVDQYRGEPERAASKVIVIGTGTGGGDALTVETVADSVRLTWLGASRPAREVKLFVTDSTQRQLASRSASPSAPTATFEISTLSAPVSFAGVTVVFVDGVTSTTVVPYRNGATGAPR